MDFLGDRLRGLRKDRKYKQEVLCIELKCRKSTISLYENNKRLPDIYTLKKIAKFYNVSTDYLLGLTDEKYNSTSEKFESLIKIYNTLTEEQVDELLSKAQNIIDEK
jgi:transcriptional regulator with XRE-family HTH domain